MGAFTKRWTIQRRRARRQKLDRLRKRYGEARSGADRAAIVAKAQGHAGLARRLNVRVRAFYSQRDRFFAENMFA